ncbi:MAG: helix-turn-helix domain-containing protein [Candidatus Fimenecus sp.]
MTIGERIKNRRLKLGYTVDYVADKLHKNRATIYRYENNEIENLPTTILEPLAKILKTTPAELMGWEAQADDNQKLYFLDKNKVYSIPIFESVSAGFGTTAINEIVDYIPLYIETKEEADNTICITVQGDSMSPKIDDGDLIQVRRQTTVDSGSVGVVLIDNEESLVKKIVYDHKSIDLISFNKRYQTMHFEGADLQRIQVLGLVKKVIKNI